MDEEIEYTPPELRPRSRPPRPGRDGGEPEKSGFWGIVTTQAIVCVIAVIFLVISQTFFPKLFEQSKQTYQKSVTAPAQVPKELAVFTDQIIAFFTDPPKQKSPAAGTSSDENASGGSSSGSSSAGQDASSGASSQSSSSQGESGADTNYQSAQKDASSQTAVPKTSSAAPNTTGIVRTSAPVGGGGIASSAPAQDAPLAPPANATFAPVLFTVKPGLPIKGAKQSSGFGYRISPITGKLEFHKALDLAAPKGTPVYAAASGTVTASAYSQSLGYYIAIKHQNGFVTRYGHCSELVAPKGALIREGEVIAKVGSTGEATGNHLHFEMSKDGIVFDPARLYDYD